MSEPTSPNISLAFQNLVGRINAVDKSEPPVGSAEVAYQELLREVRGIHSEALAIIEALCMACSTVEAVEKLIIGGIGQLKESKLDSPAAVDLGHRIQQVFAPAIALDQQVRHAFAPEIEFARLVNQLVSKKILADAGVDAEDPEAIQAYVGRNLQ